MNLKASIWLATFVASCSQMHGDIIEARYENPVKYYGHNILGDVPERNQLVVETAGQKFTLELQSSGVEAAVFEDFAPRIVDLDGDGVQEIVVVQSYVNAGAALAIYQIKQSELVMVAATKPIGRAYRWLGISGIADLDGDGVMEIAYVETPHLGKVLKLYNYKNGELTLLAEQVGFSNHRIGDNHVWGGIMDCNGQKRLQIPDGNFKNWQLVGWNGKSLDTHNTKRPFSQPPTCDG